ncbi:hypothetical protein FA809_23075 [Salmonella enterica]|nr:hypothetical protein [Salmonella enterica]
MKLTFNKVFPVLAVVAVCEMFAGAALAKQQEAAQKLTDVQICQKLGQAQGKHDKAAYNVYSDELGRREKAKIFTLDQGQCTGLAITEINKYQK